MIINAISPIGGYLFGKRQNLQSRNYITNIGDFKDIIQRLIKMHFLVAFYIVKLVPAMVRIIA
jgi:hypothetical protein